MRPTNDRLETILKDAHLRADDAGVLAAEVRALRATIARAEALPAKWLREACIDSSAPSALDACADDLEAALKGQD